MRFCLLLVCFASVGLSSASLGQMCKYFGYDQNALIKNDAPHGFTVPVFNGTNPIVEKMFTKSSAVEKVRRWQSGSCGEYVMKATVANNVYLIDVLMAVENAPLTQERGRFFRKGQCAHSSDKKKYTKEFTDYRKTSFDDSMGLDSVIKSLIEKAKNYFETPNAGKPQLIPYMVVVTDLSQQEQSRKRSGRGGNTAKVISGVLNAIGSVGNLFR